VAVAVVLIIGGCSSCGEQLSSHSSSAILEEITYKITPSFIQMWNDSYTKFVQSPMYQAINPMDEPFDLDIVDDSNADNLQYTQHTALLMMRRRRAPNLIPI